MVDQIRVVTFTSPAAPGTVDVTDPGITETFKAAILIYSGFTTDNSDNTHGLLGIGFIAPNVGTSEVDESFGLCAENGLNTTPDTGTRHSISDSINLPDPTNVASAAQLVARYSASIAGGVRLNFTTTTIQAKVTAILFAGLNDASVGGVTSGTTPLHENTGGTVDFQPDIVFFTSTDSSLNTNNNDACPSLGFALNKAGIPQVCAYVNADDATEPTDADGLIRSANSHASGRSRTGGALNVSLGTVQSFDASGFTHVSDTSVVSAHYLALKFSGAFRMACANLAVAGSTGTQTFNAFGFTPDVLIGMSTLLAAEDTTTDGPTTSCSGAFVTGRYGSRAYTWHHREGITLAGATVSEAHSRQEDVAVLTYDHLGAVAQRATWLGASGSGGFKLDFTAATVGFLTALGIQLIPNPPLPVRRVRIRWKKRPRRRFRLRLIGGVRVSFVPIRRGFWKAIGRIRRAAMARLRHRPTLQTVTPPVAIVLEDAPKGRLSYSGLVRGKIVGASMKQTEDLS